VATEYSPVYEVYEDDDLLVIVEGEFPPHEVTATGWLGPDPASSVRKKMRFDPEQTLLGAKLCTTYFTRLKSDSGLSLLRACPFTGRGHQIRATLLALGFPVAGDKLYGVDATLFRRFISDQLTSNDWLRLRIPRQALHASRLTINHPATGEATTFVASLPSSLKNPLITKNKKDGVTIRGHSILSFFCRPPANAGSTTRTKRR
jgi:23S rRNA pseudouridine955/2504/2580 synthase/23S rRNA pseudouridine1911/1915/1917 synthase